MFIIIEYTIPIDAEICVDSEGSNITFPSEEEAETYAEENCSGHYLVVQIG